MPVLILFMCLLSLVPAHARFKYLHSSDLIEAVLAQDPPYQSVEEALETRFTHPSASVREIARELTDFPAALPNTEYEKGLQALNKKAFEAAQRSPFLQSLRREILLVLDIYLRDQSQLHRQSREVTDIEAWNRAQLQMDHSFPGWRQDEAFHRENIRRAYSRAQNQTVDLWAKSKPSIPTPQEVSKRLEQLRMQLVRKSLHHFFNALDLSLYEQKRVYLEENVYEIQHTRIRNLSPGEVLDLPLQDSSGELKSGSLFLALTRPSEEIQDDRIRVFGEIHNVYSSRIGKLALQHFAHSVDLQDEDLERLLADEIVRLFEVTLEKLSLPQANATLELARLRTNIESVFSHPKLTGKGLNIAQFLRILVTHDDKDYLKKRDELAKQRGRPSLVAMIEEQAKPRTLKQKLNSFARRLSAGLTELGNISLTPKEAESKNTSLQKLFDARKSILFRFDSKPLFAPVPIIFNLTPLTEDGLQTWEPGGEEDFAITTEAPVISDNGVIAVPTSLWGQIVSLQLMHHGQTLQLGQSFTALKNEHSMRIRLAQPITDKFSLRVGYRFVPPSTVTTFDLRHLDPQGFLPEIKELRRGGLHRLADQLEDLVRTAIATNRTVSAYEIKRLFIRLSRYSFNEDYTSTAASDAEGPYAPYSGFLDSHGLLNIQCDVANDLFTLLFSHYFAHDPSIKVRSAGSITRLPFKSQVSAALAHKRTYFFQNGHLITIIDATPVFFDTQSLFDREKDLGVDTIDSQELEDAIKPSLSPEHFNQRLQAIQNKLLTIKSELIARPVVQKTLKMNSDKTHPLSKGFELANRDLLNEEIRNLAEEAKKYQGYLEKGLRSEASHLRTGLEEDVTAMDRLNQIFSLVADMESINSCEQIWQ